MNEDLEFLKENHIEELILRRAKGKVLELAESMDIDQLYLVSKCLDNCDASRILKVHEIIDYLMMARTVLSAERRYELFDESKKVVKTELQHKIARDVANQWAKTWANYLDETLDKNHLCMNCVKGDGCDGD